MCVNERKENDEVLVRLNLKSTNFIELNRLYTTQLTVVILQLVTSATCFGLVWPSSGLQRLVSIKIYNVAVPKGSHGLHCLNALYRVIEKDGRDLKPL